MDIPGQLQTKRAHSCLRTVCQIMWEDRNENVRELVGEVLDHLKEALALSPPSSLYRGLLLRSVLTTELMLNGVTLDYGLDGYGDVCQLYGKVGTTLDLMELEVKG